MKEFMNLQSWVEATGGKCLSQLKTEFTGVGTDTRQSLEGRIFVALKGDNFDAHRFLAKAVEAKAAALLVHEEGVPAEILSKVTVIRVPDTLKALQDYGRFTRRQFQHPVVAITGSNGKTTSKEFAASLLSPYRKVHYNQGSFNNHWGVPLTLIGLEVEHEVCLVEMGMNHAGELTQLVQIGEPDVVVCSTVGAAHLGHFGDLKSVARAKEEIYQAAAPKAQRIFNLDNHHTRRMWEHFKKDNPQQSSILFSSKDMQADVLLQVQRLELEQLTISGFIRGEWAEVDVPVFGQQNVTNLMVAASIGLAVGLTPQQIWQALPQCRTNWGRNQLVPLRSGAQLIFDAYNANPDSMLALIENCRKLKVRGKKYGVFGEMLEMGEQQESLHETLGEQVGQAGFAGVAFVGPSSRAFRRGLERAGFHKLTVISDTYEESLALQMANVLQTGDIVVIKGSRGMQLERFVPALQPFNFAEKK